MCGGDGGARCTEALARNVVCGVGRAVERRCSRRRRGARCAWIMMGEAGEVRRASCELRGGEGAERDVA